MPTRLLLDGDDLRSLMLRVRAEMGPDARIVRAERIRSGGIAGFFAKEHYELTVEVPDPGRPPRRRRAGVAAGDASGIDALLAAADAAERAEAAPGGARPAAQGRAPAAAAPPTSVAPAGPEADREAQDHAAGAGGVADPTEPGGAPEVPHVSTASPTFAEVLESMRQMVGPVEPAVPEVPDVPEAPAAATDPEPVTDAPGAEQPVGDPAPSGGGDRPGWAAATPPTVAAGPSPRSRSSVTALLELGIPTRMLEGFTDPAAAVPLSMLVQRFDPPPPVRLGPGAVVVVAGEPKPALRTASQMAHRAGMDVHEIVLAGDIDPVAGHGRRLQTLTAVHRFRARLTPDRTTIIVLGVGDGREAQDGASELLEAFAPDQAWGVVDARRKPVELRRWLRAVGSRRPLDAVAVTAAFEAQAPGVVLHLGTPVGWVDGLPASPIVWAAVLSERLADDAHWD